jgi:acetyl-CoA synthetase
MTDMRVAELIATYGAPDACAAELMCDRYDPSRLAYRVIGVDLAASDISYGELRDESERLAGALQSLLALPTRTWRAANRSS